MDDTRTLATISYVRVYDIRVLYFTPMTKRLRITSEIHVGSHYERLLEFGYSCYRNYLIHVRFSTPSLLCILTRRGIDLSLLRGSLWRVSTLRTLRSGLTLRTSGVWSSRASESGWNAADEVAHGFVP